MVRYKKVVKNKINDTFKITVIILLCSLFSQTIKSQNRNFSFQHYGPEDGLNNSNVFSIKQDKNHIVFLATENGVFNFDGYKFEKIKPKTALKSNYIRNIGFDLNSNLLLINRREGIFEYNKKINDVKLLEKLKFTNSVDELVLENNFAYSLNDQISTSCINLETGELFKDQLKEKNTANQAFALYKTSKNKVLVGRSDGLYFYKNGIQEKITSVNNISIYSITEDDNGLIYLGTDNAIICIQDEKIIKKIKVNTQKTSSFYSGNNIARVSKLSVDKYQRIWFTNNPDDNLYFIENNITFNAFEILGIDKVLINCIYKDSDNNIWLGTFNDGVYFIQNTQLKNITFTSDRKILPVNSCAFIDNNIAVGTINGLFIFDQETYNTQTVVAPDELFNETVFGLQRSENNIIYTKSNSINNSTHPFLIQNSIYNFTPINSRLLKICENKTEAFLADGTGTLFKINNFKNVKYSVIDTLVSYPDYRTKINTVFENTDNVFIGTTDGLSIYSKLTNGYKNYTNQIFSFAINDITYNGNKTYLAHENGISIIEDSLLIQQIGDQQLTAVKKIKFHQNKIWLATLDGLFICDTKFNPIVIINKSNGLLSNTINDIVFNNDNCCICSDKGITICSLTDLLNQKRVPNKLFITSIESDGKNLELNNSTLNLNTSQSDVMINFSSPLFIKPNKQFYRYKYNKGWFNLENRQIHLTSINGGKHQLDIICSYDGINWSDPVSIVIQKEIPLKQTSWFLFTITFIVIIAILLIAYYFVKRAKSKATKKIQEERQVNLLKHQAMNSLMSPHFIFNSLTSIQNYINLNDSLKASEYLAKFSRLIRLIIEKASQSDITLHEELTRLNYYLDLEKERFKGKFDFSIQIDPDINTFDVKIPNMIIQPYAENSIIHGILPKHEHGNLTISFKKVTQNTLQIVIEDDGIGYNKAKENLKNGHKSLGTKTIENILELNTKLTGKNQKVEIKDKSDLFKDKTGTLIIITLQI
jgi:ligand-binding sensor domain-containing protein/two-component sensor histidine kinase